MSRAKACMTAAELLDHVKMQDDNNIGVVTILTQQRIYEQLTAAWPNVARLIPRDRNRSEEYPHGSPTEAWLRWLWARVEPQPEPLWAEVAGLPDAPHVRRAMRVLQDNGVVFPDGSMSKWAKKYLEEKAKGYGVANAAADVEEF